MNLLEIKYNWKAPVVSGDIPHGDMPGDKIEIREEHIQKATKIFPELLEQLLPVFEAEESPRAVITVLRWIRSGKIRDCIFVVLVFYAGGNRKLYVVRR